MGGKEEVRDMLATSGIVVEGDKSEQMQIITQGEGLLPIRQEKYNTSICKGNSSSST
jgi:hypothetical protein